MAHKLSDWRDIGRIVAGSEQSPQSASSRTPVVICVCQPSVKESDRDSTESGDLGPLMWCPGISHAKALRGMGLLHFASSHEVHHNLPRRSTISGL